MEDNYNYAGGCGIKHPFNKAKRAECERIHLQKVNAKSGNTESDIILAKAALAKASQTETNTQMSPLAITGIVVGSLLAITLMVVVIKKVKK